MWETHGPGSESPTCRQPHPQTAILLLYATQEKRTQNHKNANMDALCSTFYDSRKWKPPKYLLNIRHSTHTMDYYPAMKRNEVLHECLNPESLLLSNRSPSPKITHCSISFECNLLNG